MLCEVSPKNSLYQEKTEYTAGEHIHCYCTNPTTNCR